jgi:hypothetical protein
VTQICRPDEGGGAEQLVLRPPRPCRLLSSRQVPAPQRCMADSRRSSGRCSATSYPVIEPLKLGLVASLPRHQVDRRHPPAPGADHLVDREVPSDVSTLVMFPGRAPRRSHRRRDRPLWRPSLLRAAEGAGSASPGRTSPDPNDPRAYEEAMNKARTGLILAIASASASLTTRQIVAFDADRPARPRSADTSPPAPGAERP